jgi:ATP-binding cassette subfamily F protein uup
LKRTKKALLNPEDEETYQKTFDRMDQPAWDFYGTQYKPILFKLKLEDFKLKVNLSGGQKKRLFITCY